MLTSNFSCWLEVAVLANCKTSSFHTCRQPCDRREDNGDAIRRWKLAFRRWSFVTLRYIVCLTSSTTSRRHRKLIAGDSVNTGMWSFMWLYIQTEYDVIDWWNQSCCNISEMKIDEQDTTPTCGEVGVVTVVPRDADTWIFTTGSLDDQRRHNDEWNDDSLLSTTHSATNRAFLT